ncbi:pentapeptide repeat-containing protein [Methylocapsa sp. D3K7]|uniref:pentapeptide repeat-containing protein n=1 Tax=Methylocapsa sp. D3K7 TaxID=3041435 RepID=UPI00244E85B1|nr:pentapeptide repeat-containing protein [Methylocapsa sp. D3K7]WGJ13099.1 pentapeptide repeat-containing protein [Methylocapsa sp. D3K7]
MQQPRLRAWRLAKAAKRSERQTALPPVAAGLPAIAEKADDLAEIKKSVEDAAAVSGGLWLSYLFVLFYVAIAAGAVTHEDLLLERAVKLPFLNIELPLLAFFALAPFIVLIIHAYALMHFIMLGKKASRFHAELKRQFPDALDGAVADQENKAIRDKLRRLLPSNIFVQILAGPPELRGGIFGLLLKLIALTTLVVFPVLLLLLLQIQFLPFHHVTITWAQRVALFLDIVLLWLLRPPVFAGLSGERSGYSRALVWGMKGSGFFLEVVTSFLVIWFSIVVATIPGEWPESTPSVIDQSQWRLADNAAMWTQKFLFAGDVDETTRRRKSLFSNTLVLPGFNIYEALKIDDPKKLTWKEHLFDLRGRHLEKAVLDGADLTKADLTGAFLDSASLQKTQLQGALLNEAQLRGALLNEARLQGASLKEARLQGASLKEAQLQGASLDKARLQGVSLKEAQLQGASLNQAQLQLAELDRAEFQGATLWLAELQNTSLLHAELEGVTLEGAHLEGAVLHSARLQGAVLDGATINQTDFVDAILWRTHWSWSEPDPVELGAIRLEGVTWNSAWKPRDKLLPFFLLADFWGALKVKPWDANAYADLRNLMNTIPEGKMRDEALMRIERLDCTSKDKSLASCDPAAKLPQDVLYWKKKLARTSVDYSTYAKALAKELRGLICVKDVSAVYILRGIIQSKFLQVAGPEAAEIVNFITTKDCPVSVSLTDDDKAALLEIKQKTEIEIAPSPASKKEK